MRASPITGITFHPVRPAESILESDWQLCYVFNMEREQVIALLRKNRDVMHRFSVRGLYIFGSVARGEGKKDSDVDILVEYEPDAHVGLFQFVRLRRELSDILGCEVDLATPESLHKELREDILKEAVHAA
jgi:predicted nucleotidyltransferase